MITIPSSFEHRGFIHTEVARKGEWRVYERRPHGVTISHWEVVKILEAKERFAFGKIYPPQEVYPRSEAWGTHGFTLTTLAAALAKLAAKALE